MIPNIDQESGSNAIYEEFMNCKSNNYIMEEKDDSEAISSNGEFDEFKECEELSENDPYFIQ